MKTEILEKFIDNDGYEKSIEQYIPDGASSIIISIRDVFTGLVDCASICKTQNEANIYIRERIKAYK